jgi:hypothetical protein
MLRNVLLILAAGFAAIGLLLVAAGSSSPGWPMLGWGAVVVIALLAERWRYRRVEHARGGRWQATGERFEDPETRQTVEVLYDPATGERRYVPAREEPSGPGA